MPSPLAESDLVFYRELQQYDIAQPEARHALHFARAWSDLARRVLAARSAQAGIQAASLPPLGLPAFRAYFNDGAGMSASGFLQAAPADWPLHQAKLLADLSAWFAKLFQPADPLAASYQVWVGNYGDQHVALYGPAAEAPVQPLVLFEQPPCNDWLIAQRERPVAVIAHYDVHGLSMLALTLRHLRSLGIAEIDCTLSFELTGDISKLWKRTVPRALNSSRDYAAIVMIDCSVHSRRPERTVKALAQLEDSPQCRFYLVDHHDDTLKLAPALLNHQLDLVLTDVVSCGLVAEPSAIERQLMTLGALGDKVPEIVASCSNESHADLHAANQAFHQRMIHFSPTPKELKQRNMQPLSPLWEALAAGKPISAALADDILGELAGPPPPELPAFFQCGSLLFVTDRLQTVGRTWYAILEQLMQREDAPYAVALRILDKRRANMLLLTHWSAIHLPPIRHFVPPEYWPQCLGHAAAVWIDVQKGEALRLLAAVTKNLNSFLNTPCDFAPAASALQSGIIDPSDQEEISF